MTIQFLPLAESLEAQRLGLGDSEFVWVGARKNPWSACRECAVEGGAGILGPAYLPCEIKAGIISISGCNGIATGGTDLQSGDPDIIEWWASIDMGDSENTKWMDDCHAPTESLALFALYKKIKESTMTKQLAEGGECG